MYSADFSPCCGSEKQTAKVLEFAMQSGAEPDGVSWNMLSFTDSFET